MPEALFFNVPGHGHVNPSLPLVAELVRRGNHITYFVTEGYRARVEAAGAVFHPYATVQDDYFDARGLSGSVPGQVACSLITTAGDILPELLEMARAEQPDTIIYDGMCPWGYFAARILGVPAIASLSLMALPPRALLNWQALRSFIPIMFRDRALFQEASRRSQALGKQYGIAPLGFTHLMNAFGDLNFSYTSSYFQPYARTLGETFRFVGWTASDGPANGSFSLEQVQGRRLIYASLGTVNNDDAEFFRTCIEAFSGRDEFVIMSTGNRFSPDLFSPLPENVSIHAWVPQPEVLKRAALFITHAGMNSVHDGLYYGVPLLLIPQQAEQAFTALRVAELGAGLVLRREKATAETMRDKAARLLSEPRFKAEANHIGDTLRAAGGASRAADEIEALLRNHTGSRTQKQGG